MKLQSAVKKETVAVAVGTGVGCLLLIAVFLIFYLIFPESSVKFDYRVVLGALVGGAVAVANFFLMAVTVQNVVNVKNQDDALRMMHASYRNRMLMRVIWIIIAIFAPCFNYAAGITELRGLPAQPVKILRNRQIIFRKRLKLRKKSPKQNPRKACPRQNPRKACPRQNPWKTCPKPEHQIEAFCLTGQESGSAKRNIEGFLQICT